MPKAKTDTQTFISLIEAHGVRGAAKRLGSPVRAVQKRRRRIEESQGITIASPFEPTPHRQRKARLEVPFRDGVILVGSDAHYWPGEVSTGHRAFVKMCSELQPDIVIMNGDAVDAACISRYPPIGWEDMPTVAQELETVQDRLREIMKASATAQHIWTLGNHDARFETRLAMVAPEFKHVHGVHLKDHFPDWTPCWSVFIGGKSGIVVKHRFKGGIHAPHNNTMWAGRSMLTGHLHGLRVHPFTDYNGTRYGVDGGCLADPLGPQFEGYTEDNPLNWREGFVVLTFKDGELLFPEVVPVHRPGVIQWRGELIDV